MYLDTCDRNGYKIINRLLHLSRQRQRHEDSTESSPVDGGAVENVPATGLRERGLLVSGLHGPEQGEATLLLRGPAEADTGNCQYLEPEETTQ